MHLLDVIKKQITKIKHRLSQYHSGSASEKLSNWINAPDNTIISKWWAPGIPNIDDVMHGATCPKSTRLKWFGMDSEESFDNIILKPHDKWNFTNNNVTYTFNSFGYRGDEPAEESDYTVLVSGDSHSFGVALDDKQVWTSRLKTFLKQKYKNPKIINISCPGGANDWISRSIVCSLETLKPDLVIAVYTYPNRREAIWDSGFLWELNTSIPDNPNQDEYEQFQSWFMTINEHTDYYNLTRNHLLIKNCCEKNNIRLITSHVQQLTIFQILMKTFLKYTDVARDCKHFGPAVHTAFAEKLYKEINDN